MSRALAVLTVALGLTAALACAGSPPASEFADVQDGDVVLRHARGRWSNYFRDASPVERRFSHVGIIAHDAAGIQVIHADASDTSGVGHVRCESLAVFLRDADDWAIFRVRAPAEQRARIAIEACGFLGVPFDARFDVDDASRVYCTELVYRAFRHAVGPDVIPLSGRNGRNIVFLDSCYLGPEFAVVAERLR